MAAFLAFSPLALRRSPSLRRTRTCGKSRTTSISMSGVNGGIDYEIDLSTLPTSLASRVRTIQNGPDSPSELILSATEIAAAAPTLPQTLPVLVDMLGYNNPIAARIAISALVSAGTAAIPSLLIGVGAFNYAVNAYALRALGGIGDPSVLAVCVACAKSGPIPGVRRAACAALAALNYEDADAANSAYDVLLRIADQEPDWGVRYSAVAGLEKFNSVSLLSSSLRDTCVCVLQGILDGKCYFPREEERIDGQHVLKSDPTVMARATVALEVLLATKQPI